MIEVLGVLGITIAGAMILKAWKEAFEGRQ